MRKSLVLTMVSLLFLTLALVTLSTAQENTTITGEVVDTYCFVKAGDMGIGPGHKMCAEVCAKGGVPLGILENKTKKLYMLAVDEVGKNANPLVEKYLVKKVKVTGKIAERGGQSFILVKSVEPVE